jgi:hypothetical protein
VRADPDRGELRKIPFAALVRARQVSSLPPPRTGETNLPLGDLDPEALERLAAEMIKRRPNHGAHFYGRRGQKQYWLDIVEREAPGVNSVYQVRRYEKLTPEDITSAVTEYADPKQPQQGADKPARRFSAYRYVLFTSAEFETDTALQDELDELDERYSGDLIIEVWGREMISALLRDSGALVNSVFGPDWARAFCGFAPPPPEPGDPAHLGLVENPVQALNLDAMAADAKALETSDPSEAARLYGIVADTLQEANFPAHAAGLRVRQAQQLHAGKDIAAAFGIWWDLAVAELAGGAVRKPGSVFRGLDALEPELDERQAAKLTVLGGAYDWYEQGSLLSVVVPALEKAVTAADPDAAFLACITLEQALADGWFDYNPPYSLVTPEGNTPDLLGRLRRCADGLTSSDVVLRARLACAVADAILMANAGTAEAEAAYGLLLRAAGAGRYLHAGGLVFARAARAFAMHGDTVRAIDLWRQSILLSSESRRYGDVLACRRALNAAILEQPVPPVAELDFTSSLPNDIRLLSGPQSASAQAVRAVHAGQLPDAFVLARRYLREARLSGHLSDERDALEIFGDVLLTAGRPDVAVTAWMMGGIAGKAADVAGHFVVPLDARPWVSSPSRACQAAAAQVIGAQAWLYGPDTAEEPVHLLLGLTPGLWTTRRIAPDPPVDAVKAVSRFGVNLPASVVDPVLALVQPHAAAGGELTPEAAELMIQLYWAVPARREDLAAVIMSQLSRDDPPPGLWDMVANLPEQARGPVATEVSVRAADGNRNALLTLAVWRQPTADVQLAARRTAANLLRCPAGQSWGTWSFTTQFADTVSLLVALADAPEPFDVDPRDLRQDAGPVLTGRAAATITVSVGQPAAATMAAPRPPQVSGDTGSGGTSTQAGTTPATETNRDTEPDPAAVTAAGPPASVASAVAGYLLVTAENQHAPAFARVEAVAALRILQHRLPADVNALMANRLLAVAENPALSDFDQAEIASQDPLSRQRLDTGAKNLAMFALLTAAGAAAQAAEADPGIEALPGDAVQRLLAHAVQLLHSPIPQAARYGAGALAWASRYATRLAPLTTALITHPSSEVREIAAAMADLDESAQQILAADPSPKVRARLAARADELAHDIRAALATDTHPEVRRAMASIPDQTETQIP